MYIPYSIKTYVPIILLIALSFWFTAQYIEPPPPKSVTLAAGSKSGFYYQSALKYKSYLENEGLDVTILETSGSVDNIGKLHSGDADIAFVQGGLATEKERGSFESLSSLFYEPLWIFVRSTKRESNQIVTLKDLQGKKAAIGAKGSGTHALSAFMLDINGLTDTETTPLSGSSAITALKNKEIDAAFFVSNIESPLIHDLLADEELQVISIPHNLAYEKNYDFLSALQLPASVIDIANNIPATDIQLISPAAMLVANETFHPALKALLVHSTYEIYQEQHNLYAKDVSFPTIHYADLPISKQAQRYFENGPSILNKYLPFWVADMINRLKIMIIPLLTVMLPLMKIAPPAYRWSIRSKIYKWYKSLKKMENNILSKDQDTDINDTIRMLNEMDDEAKKTPVPLSYADSLYNLRLHIQMIRDKLIEMKK